MSENPRRHPKLLLLLFGLLLVSVTYFTFNENENIYWRVKSSENLAETSENGLEQKLYWNKFDEENLTASTIKISGIEVVYVLRCIMSCSKYKQDESVQSDEIDLIFASLTSFIKQASPFGNKAHIIASKSCSKSVRSMIKEKWPSFSHDAQLTVTFVENGGEMKTIFLLPDASLFSAVNSKDSVEGLYFQELNFETKKLYKYPWYNLRLPQLNTDKVLLFIDPKFDLNFTALSSLLSRYSKEHKRPGLLYQEGETSLFESLKIDKAFVRSHFLGFLFKFQSQAQTLLNAGKFPFSSSSIKLNTTREKKNFDKWFEQYGKHYQKLSSYRAQTAITPAVFQALKIPSLMLFNYSDLQKAMVNHTLEDIENFDSASTVFYQYFNGYLTELKNLAVAEKVSGISSLTHKLKADSYIPLLQSLRLPIRARHVTMYVNRVEGFVNTQFWPGSKQESADIFFFRTHKISPRIEKTVLAWSKQLSIIKVPFVINLVSINPDLIQSFVSLREKAESKFSIVLTNSSSQALGSFFPVEALEVLQASQRLYGGKFQTTKIGDISLLSVDTNSGRLPWLFTQITWVSVFAKLLLEPEYFSSSKLPKLWFIDYDVAFTGNIARLINLTRDIDADFMAPSQNLNNKHIPEHVLKAESTEHRNHWFWWDWGHAAIKHRQELSRYESCTNEWYIDDEPRPLLRRSFATSLRLSHRMIEWVIEAMFDPEHFFWPLDEMLYRTTCELNKNCSYFSFSSVDTKRLDTNYTGIEIAREQIAGVGTIVTNFVANFKNHRSGKSGENRFIEFIKLNATHNQLWHPIKLDNILPGELEWLD